MKKIKVLHVIPNLLKGGAQRMAIDICNALHHRDDVQVRLIYLGGTNEFSFATNNIDVQMCPASVMPSISGRSKVNIAEYERLLDEYKPDVIHSHLFPAELVTRERPRQTIKYFTHCHDNMRQLQSFGIGTLRSKLKSVEFYERQTLMPKYRRINNVFIAISKDNQSYLLCVLPRSLRKNVKLLPNAINLVNFRPAREKVCRRRMAFLPIKLVNVGNLLDNKNQIFLIDIMDKLRNQNVKAHLKIIGDGPNRKKLAEAIEERHLINEIQLLGAQDNVADFLAESHICVHTALREAFGLVLVEAMAVGLPVVALDGKGNRDVVADGKNGYIIPQQNPELFAQKIMDIMSDHGKYEKMSSFAADYAEENFGIASYTEKILALYKGTETST